MQWLLIDRVTHEIIGKPSPERPDDSEDAYATIVMAGYPDTCAWVPALQGFVTTTPAQTVTPLAFQRLFTQAERIAIRTSTDPIVQDFMALAMIAQDIGLGDPDVMAGVEYLETAHLIGTGRAATILGKAPIA